MEPPSTTSNQQQQQHEQQQQQQQQQDDNSTGANNNNDDDGWDKGVPQILQLLDQLEESNAEFGAVVWEYDWERRDMLEDLQSIRQILREGILHSSLYHSTVQRVLGADSREVISDLEAALRAERSKNWELAYYARDIEEDRWKLQVMLRSSVPVQDGLDPLSKAKTALERALELQIAELRESIRNPKGRGRSKSV
ncbi:hypothetical protein QBC43DRAFT_323325 [Cladorrhinum sp. PSN259]|nr:hypothetical protein QBC43DRAFT_323325 [Cladorrhinum sp. PSN259]